MSSPLLIPPCTPPELFVAVRIFPPRISNGSLCSEPRIRVAVNPEPISNPFVAGKLSNAFNHATDRVAFAANLLDKRRHLLRCRGIGTANRILLHIPYFHSGTIDFRDDLMNLRDVSDDLELRVKGRQYLFRDCARCDPANGLARRRATATLPVPNSIFGLVSEISM